MITPQITRLDLNGLGGMTDVQATELGRRLATSGASEIQSTLATLSPDDRSKVVVAYLAAGGSTSKLKPIAPSRPRWLVPIAVIGLLAAGGVALVLLRRRK